MAHHDPSGFLHCAVSLEEEATGLGSRVLVRRFVNGVPLMSTNSGTCHLLAGALAGTAKMCPSMGIELAGGGFRPESIVTCGIWVAKRPQESTWTALVVRVNLVQPPNDVDYNCLSKDGVVGIKSSAAGLAGIVSRCVRSGLRKVQTKFPNQFQSNEDYERKRALNVYIPSIAHNLAACLVRSGRDLAALGGTEDAPDAVEARLRKALTDAVLSQVPR